MRVRMLGLGVLLSASVGVLGCKGPAGKEGPAGAACWDLDASDTCDLASEDINGDNTCNHLDCDGQRTAAYIGSDECASCHRSQYQKFVFSGHAFKLNPVVSGQIQSNVDPAAHGVTGWTNKVQENMNGVASLPYGLTWNDVSYVIGGWGWKARFMDRDGYIVVTDAADTAVQYNLPNAALAAMSPEWVAYSKSTTSNRKQYDCGPCHTTGYDENATNPLPGIVGTWALSGIHCEACHGPGSLHAATGNPSDIVVDRSSESCGRCHTRGAPAGMDGVLPAPEAIEAKGGFVEHHEQFDEIWNSKHRSLTCVSCHDPHASSMNAETANPAAGQGVKAACGSCHWNVKTAWTRARASTDTAGASTVFHPMKLPKGPSHGADDDGTAAYPPDWVDVGCTACHMAPTGKSARSKGKTADVHNHTMAITSDASVQYFSSDGKFVEDAVLPLEYACASCHEDTAVAGSGPALAACRTCHSASGIAHPFENLADALSKARDGTLEIHPY